MRVVILIYLFTLSVIMSDFNTENLLGREINKASKLGVIEKIESKAYLIKEPKVSLFEKKINKITIITDDYDRIIQIVFRLKSSLDDLLYKKICNKYGDNPEITSDKLIKIESSLIEEGEFKEELEQRTYSLEKIEEKAIDKRSIITWKRKSFKLFVIGNGKNLDLHYVKN